MAVTKTSGRTLARAEPYPSEEAKKMLKQVENSKRL
jgi:hypothetical protein